LEGETMSGGNSLGRGLKRKLDQQEGSELLGVGSTLSRLNDDSAATTSAKPTTTTTTTSDDGGGEWTTVDRSSKRHKKSVQQSYPQITHAANARLQSFVKLSDLQNLVLYLLADGNGPQWISVRHKKDIERVVCLMVPGLEADMFNANISLNPQDDAAPKPSSAVDPSVTDTMHIAESSPSEPPAKKLKTTVSPDDYYPVELITQKLPTPLRPFADMFPHIWPVKTPGEYNRMHSPLQALLTSPLPKSKDEKKIKGPRPPREGPRWQNVRTPITDFLATREDLSENGYAIHPAYLRTDAEREAEKARRYKHCQTEEDGWIDLPAISSLDEGIVPPAEIDQGSILQGRNVLTVDCEMISTSLEKFALARVSLIDWDGNIVLDELVKPPGTVSDYLTQYSGITKEMMEPVTQTLAELQTKLRQVLTPRTILLGHSLDSDLRALRLSFPFIVDTTLIYPHPKGPPQKSSLKWLTQKYLAREIQNRGPQGHDSVEDAKACLDLVKQKCEKGKMWGTSEATSESIFKRLGRTGSEDEEATTEPQQPGGRTGAVVDWGDPKRGHGAAATCTVSCESDTDVVAGVTRAIKGPTTSDDISRDENIPIGGCDFVWARLRELEALRGWWNRTTSADAAARLASTLASNGASCEDQDIGTQALADAVTRTTANIKAIYDSLPPKTAFIVYSGGGDPSDMRRLQAMHQQYKRDYQTMKWDDLSIKWTDVEEQALKQAAVKARSGVGFVVCK
jgi:RNA exonuclease 1